MDAWPFISVILPTHSRLPQLKQALASVRQQIYPADRYELVVVDDGSTDGTAHYLRQQAEAGNLRYLSQPAAGAAAARNAGARLARGEIVAFTDDDCLPEAGWLTALAQAYAPAPRPVAVGGRIESVLTRHWLYPYYAVRNRYNDNYTVHPVYLNTANASFLRSVFWEVGGFDEAFPSAASEDVELGFRLAAAGYTLDFTPAARVWHVDRTSLWALVRQSLQRGYGRGILLLKWPHCDGPPSQGWRWRVRQTLNQVVRLAEHLPRAVKPVSCGLTLLAYRLAFILPEIEYWGRHVRPQHKAYYAEFSISPAGRYVYLLLDVLDILLQRAGEAMAIARLTYQHTATGETWPPPP